MTTGINISVSFETAPQSCASVKRVEEYKKKKEMFIPPLPHNTSSLHHRLSCLTSETIWSNTHRNCLQGHQWRHDLQGRIKITTMNVWISRPRLNRYALKMWRGLYDIIVWLLSFFLNSVLQSWWRQAVKSAHQARQRYSVCVSSCSRIKMNVIRKQRGAC